MTWSKMITKMKQTKLKIKVA